MTKVWNFIKTNFYLKVIYWAFGIIMFFPYVIKGIEFTFMLGRQFMGPWTGFMAAGLFVSIGVIPVIIWVGCKVKKAFEDGIAG